MVGKKSSFQDKRKNKLKKIVIQKETKLSEILKLAPACSCSACNHGCKFGSGYFVDNQIEKVSEKLKISLDNLKSKYLTQDILLNRKLWRPKRKRERLKMPFGVCVFFDSKLQRCKIHDVKPLQCQIAMGCKDYGEDLMKWFMVNYVLDLDDNESIREYATYVKLGSKVLKGANLKNLIKDDKKLAMILNRDI